jgi:membrane fusion protein, multidrug efflux system
MRINSVVCKIKEKIKTFNVWKTQHKFPTYFIAGFITIGFLYYFAYCFPFTNNAFVIANIRPVAANVEGYITKIYVKDEEVVKKGAPLFTVFEKPYQYAYEKAVADVAEANATLIALEKQVEKTEQIVQSKQSIYEKIAFDYTRYQKALSDHSVSEIRVNNLLRDKNSAYSTLKSLEKSLELDKQNIIVKKMNIRSLEAIMHNAKVDLDETTVYAKNDGIVHNMFSALGSPIEIRQPIFSFIDIDPLFIQANFNETDLRLVKAGDKVSIYPRMYFWTKTYHGVVVSKNWAANRQVTDNRTQEQVVTNNENNWFLLPQRLPVQIRIIDYDPENYPLSMGSSAYVWIHV